MATAFTRRAGFTLIELLVVIALIATLAALSAGAFTQVRKTQMKKATDASLNKLHSALDNRWKAIEESVNEDARKNQGQWQNALATAGGDVDIAKSLLLYAKVKNQLPMSFNEARSPTTVGSITFAPRANFAALPAGTGTYEESAICFYLAIRTSGGGGAMTDGEGLEQQSSESTAPAGFRLFKDTYGMPIAFVRHAYSSPELDQAPYVRAGAANKDPFDPTPNGKLATFMTAYPAIWGNIILNAPAFAMIPGIYPAKNNLPTLISAGPNKSYEANIFGGSNNDNQISYRVRREGTSGD